MKEIAIRIDNLGKMYRIGAREKKAITLRERIQNFMLSPFDYLREVLREPTEEEILWALKDINFQVKHGEVVGIIGRNGAGKSTLLKILSRITEPTEGQAALYGRVSSLLEVGTGFHKELTGRENIYLNGTVLGMSRAEVDRKFDEIVDFSGVEKFIDTPVKRYSSGMRVRLAFSVAAHLEPEILLIDEVLAVGDAEFQRKCLGKMRDVASEGRTVLFVSHNMGAVRKLCEKGILLDKGKITKIGSINQVIDTYLGNVMLEEFEPIKVDSLKIKILNISLNESMGGTILPFEPLVIDIEIDAEADVTGIGLQVMISKDTIDGELFCSNTKQTKDIDLHLKKGKNKVTCSINSFNMCSGDYLLGIGIDSPNVSWFYYENHVLSFEVQETMYGSWSTLPIYSHIYLDHAWFISH